MRRGIRAGLVALATVGCVAAGLIAATYAQGDSKSEALAVGKRRYTKYCATCHGPSATGDGVAAATFAKKPTDLTLLAKQNGGKFPTSKVISIVSGDASIPAHGSQQMPVWGEILGSDPTTTGEYSPEEARLKILTIAQYLESIQQK